MCSSLVVGTVKKALKDEDLLVGGGVPLGVYFEVSTAQVFLS